VHIEKPVEIHRKHTYYTWIDTNGCGITSMFHESIPNFPKKSVDLSDLNRFMDGYDITSGCAILSN
jgi:hypothetical protein